MFSTETKTATAANNLIQAKRQPFFNKEGQGGLFSKSNEATTPFFSPTTIQPKLTIGQPNDKYEVEADTMADKVVQRLGESSNQNPSTGKTGLGIQRKCSHCEEEEKLQKKEDGLSESPKEVQRKPIFESNAERPDTDIQTKPLAAPSIQAKCSSCEQEEKLQKKEEEELPDNELPLQRKGMDIPSENTPDLESRLSSSKGGGSSLSTGIQTSMGSEFGADFSNVKVHTGSEAVQMSQDIGAQAFTHGSDIYFNQGKYDTNSTSGKHLLAHELTHTVQQGGALNRKIQKQETEKTTKSFDEIGKSEWGKIKETATGKHLELYNFRVKENINASELRLKLPYELPKDERKTKQRSAWKKGVKQSIKNQLNDLVNDQDPKRQKYLLSIRGNDYVAVTGTINQIVNEVNVPYWDNGGNPATFQVEHIVDHQIAGGKDRNVDVVSNLILLDAKVNNKLGSVIRSGKIKHIETVLKHYKDADVVSSASEALNDNDFKITIESLNSSIRVRGTQYVQSDILNPKANNNPFRKRIITLKKFEIPKGHFLLKTSQSGAGYVIPYNANGYKAGSFDIYANGNAENHTLTTLILDPIVDAKNVKKNKKEVSFFEGQDIEVKGTDVFLISGLKRRLRNLFDLTPFSPVELNDKEMDFRGLNLRAFGKVDASIPFLKDLDINVSFNGANVALEKTFLTSELTNKIPKPFKVDNSYLTLGLSTGVGIYVNGGIDFSIPNLGEGAITASANKKGFILSGTFDFESEKFDKATLDVGYDSEKDKKGNSPWSIGGDLVIGEDKFSGVKSLKAKISYNNNILDGIGSVELDIPGFEGKHSITASYNTDDGSFGITTELALPDSIPGLKGGDVIQLGISKKAGESDYNFTIGGSAEISILGLKPIRIDINYENGAILIIGETPFSFNIANKEASGKIKLGVTNQKIAENKPTGEISDEWTLFGEGEVSLELAEGIGGKAKVTILPEGDIVASGELGLDPSKSDSSGRKTTFDKFIFEKEFGPVTIFRIPAIGASLQLKIKTFLKRVGYYTPPYIKELSIGLNNFNLSNPDDNDKLRFNGHVIVAMNGGGGIIAGLTLTATMTIGFVGKIKGGLEGSVGVEAGLGAEACLNVIWSEANGLEIEAGYLLLEGSAQFLAELKGYIRVYLDLWLAEIDLWKEDLDIAKVYFGTKQALSFGLPVSMNNGKLNSENLDEKKIDFPDITSDEKQQSLAKEAVEQDSKVAPPRPPSKEKATKVVRGLPSGRINTGIKSLDANQIKLIYPNKMVKRNWIEDMQSQALKNANYATRDSYLYWLNHRYTEMDWSEARAAGIVRDRAELEQLKYLMFNNNINEKKAKSLVKKFKRDHYYFTNKFGSEIDQLLNSGFQSRLPETLEEHGGQFMSMPPPPESPEPYISYPSEEDYSQYMSYPDEGNFSVDPELELPEVEVKPCDKVQLKSNGTFNVDETPIGIESKLNTEKGKGKALPDEAQEEMGDAFGEDFSQVKIHDDNSSKEMNQKISAEAFTHGSDIYFNDGKYDTSGSSGKHLLAHELTHTVQQGAFSAQINIQKSDDDEARITRFNSLSASIVDEKIPEFRSGVDEHNKEAVQLSGRIILLKWVELRRLARDMAIANSDASEELDDSRISQLLPNDIKASFESVRNQIIMNMTTQAYRGSPLIGDYVPFEIQSTVSDYIISQFTRVSWVIKDLNSIIEILGRLDLEEDQQWTVIGLFRQHQNPYHFAYMTAVLEDLSLVGTISNFADSQLEAWEAINQSQIHVLRDIAISPAEALGMLRLMPVESKIELLQPLTPKEISRRIYNRVQNWREFLYPYNRMEIAENNGDTLLQAGTTLRVIPGLISDPQIQGLFMGVTQALRREQEEGRSPYLRQATNNIPVVGNDVTFQLFWPSGGFPDHDIQWAYQNDPTTSPNATRVNGESGHISWHEDNTNDTWVVTARYPGIHRIFATLTPRLTFGRLRELSIEQIVLLEDEQTDIAFTQSVGANDQSPREFLQSLRERRRNTSAQEREEIDARISEIETSLEEDTRHPLSGQRTSLRPLRAVFISSEDQPLSVPLRIFIGSDPDWFAADTRGFHMKLWDYTLQEKFTATGEHDRSMQEAAKDALESFAAYAPYPDGILRVRVPGYGISEQDEIITIETGGGRDVIEFVRALSMISMAVGVVAAFTPIPGARLVAITAFAVGSALGGAAGTMSISSRLENGNFELDLEAGMDILDIAGAVMTFGASSVATATVRGVGRVTFMGRMAQAVDLTQIVVMSGMHVAQIAAAVESGDRDRVINAILSALADGALFLIVHRAGRRLQQGGASPDDPRLRQIEGRLQESTSIIRADGTIPAGGESHGMSLVMVDGLIVVRICSPNCSQLARAIRNVMGMEQVQGDTGLSTRLETIHEDSVVLERRVNDVDDSFTMEDAQYDVNRMMEELRSIRGENPAVIDAIFMQAETMALNDQTLTPQRIETYREQIRDLGRRPNSSQAADGAMQRLDNIVQDADLTDAQKIFMIEAQMPGIVFRRSGTRDRPMTEVDMTNPAIRRLFDDAISHPQFEGFMEWRRFIELVRQRYFSSATLFMGRSVRTTDRRAVRQTNEMRSVFVLAMEGGTALPEATSAVRDHLTRTISSAGSPEAAVAAGDAAWINRLTGARTEPGDPEAMLWPASHGRVWQVDHLVEIQHGGPDAPGNYFPVPEHLHRYKSAAMNNFGNGAVDITMSVVIE